MNRHPTAFVLDSFALIAFFRAEPGGGRVAEMLAQADQGSVRLSMSVVNLGELFYRTAREYGFERARAVLSRVDDYTIELINVDRPLALSAAVLKARYRMSYADCVAAALAERLEASVVTGDPEFRQVEHVIAIEWLPLEEDEPQ